jgi:hypothetical protein
MFSNLLNGILNGEITLKEALNAAYNMGLTNKTEYKSSEYKIIRTYSAGVFMGVIESINGKEAVIRDARRLWYWEGAASLSQLAVDGTSKPEKCKFPVAVDRVDLKEVIEVIDVTEKAKKSIDGVKTWEV